MFSKKWIKLAPIIDLQNVDVWLLLMIKNLPINQRYLNGSSRVGCVICPYSSSYEDELIKYISHINMNGLLRLYNNSMI